MPQDLSSRHRSERGFWGLLALQTQGAFSDNLYKQILIIGMVAAMGLDASHQAIQNGVIGAVFLLPFLLFSCWAGMLADKFSKRTITLATKVWELGVMTLGLFAIASHSFHFALGVLFLMGAQSAFFSPSKYGIIPELVRPERLSWANGMIELTTFVSIILGVAAAAALLQLFGPDGLHYVMYILIALSVVGWAGGLLIDRTPRANPDRKIQANFGPELMRYFRIINADKRLKWTVIGLAYFWAMGSLVMLNVNVWGEKSLGMSAVGGGWIREGAEWVRHGGQWWQMGAGWLYLVMALGIAAGAALAGRLSGDHIEVGLVPIGGMGMALFTMPLGFGTPGDRLWIFASLFMLGVCGGLFSVPLNAILQFYTDKEDRGGLIGANNFISFSAMILAAVFLIVFNKILDPDPNLLFLVLTVATFTGTYVIMRLLPQAAIRFIGFLLVRVVYRIRILHRERIPAEGPALIVANHTSFIDAVLIQAISPRPVRFIAYEGIYNKPMLKFIMRTMRAIPISSAQNPKALMRSLEVAGRSLDEGELVCIFAEGQISRTGMMLPFQRGYQFILKKHPAPVLPINIEGVWGSIFSFAGGRFFWKWPRHIPYRVTLAVGEALPSDAAPFKLRQAIQDLGAEAAIAGRSGLPPIHHDAIRTLRRQWRKPMMLDMLTPAISSGQVLWRSTVLARRLRKEWGGHKTVGILLPPSVGASLVNFAAALSGRCVVNLNYTAGADVLKSCCEQSGIETVITARPFLDKTNIEPPVRAIFIEDFRGFQGLGEVIAAMTASMILPIRMLERFCGAVTRPTADSPLTIIFSSGTTGMPKGVELTHGNIGANIASVRQGVAFMPEDRMLGILPLFHSMGYMATLWLPLHVGCGVVYHFSPVDPRAIGELTLKHQVNILIATPTFLQFYLRKVDPAQFGKLRFVITGAEKLPVRVRDAFKEKFGLDVYEGYGTTECSPLVAINVPHFRAAGFFQAGHKSGSIGHPIPGVAVRIADPDTGEEQPPAKPGLLMVKGPNVMDGYLNLPEKTGAAFRDGWYDTGDVAYVDEDGFIFITDRLARFSKIGGEMVPHVTVQDKLQEISGETEPAFVVTAIPDEGKGEKLVVLYTVGEDRIEEIQKHLADSGLPNLFIPRQNMYFKVGEFPVLGTGKLDLAGVKAKAKELGEA